MAETGKRTAICSVVFVDIVEYSKKSVSRQLSIKERFNQAVARALGDISPSDRIILDTGDGAALCFLGEPEEALFTANALLVEVFEMGDPDLALRIGVNLGPVKIVRDINEQPNLIGDGINVAQRVMGFAQPNQVLVSRSYYEVVAHLSDEYQRLFQYHGVRKDKHVREHEVYLLCLGPGSPPPPPPPQVAVVEPASLPSVSDAERAQIEVHLSRYLGPVAKVIVAREAQRVADADELRQAVARNIARPDERAAFLASFASRAPAPPRPSHVEPDRSVVPGRAPEPSRVHVESERSFRPALDLIVELDADAVAQAEKRLASYIGPLAKLLVHRAMGRAGSIAELYEILAPEIDDPKGRGEFLAAGRRR